MAKPEYRLKAGSSQDRSVTHENYARTTDKGLKNSGIYSLLYRITKETVANIRNY